MFVRYYAVHIICHNDLLINHIFTIFRCIIAFKVSAIFDEFLNNSIVKIKHNAFLRINNNDIF